MLCALSKQAEKPKAQAATRTGSSPAEHSQSFLTVGRGVCKLLTEGKVESAQQASAEFAVCGQWTKVQALGHAHLKILFFVSGVLWRVAGQRRCAHWCLNFSFFYSHGNKFGLLVFEFFIFLFTRNKVFL